MATHMPESRKAVRGYLNLQWITMSNTLGNPKPEEDPKDGSVEKARKNFVAFEEALSFPYNQKLAFFPADKSDTTGSGRAGGEFRQGSLLVEFESLGRAPSYKELAAHQSAMLASLYARQEFIRAAARMPMTLFVGPEADWETPKDPRKTILLTSEKFSRVVFSGITTNFDQYVAVVQLSQIYPQNGVVRVWWIQEPALNELGGIPDLELVLKTMKDRWNYIAGDEKGVGKFLFQRGTSDASGIPLRTRGLKNTELYVKHVETRADMWANVMALTGSDKHGDTNLLDPKTKKKLWEDEGSEGDVSMKGWQWMAAMLALRRIPYIVKSEATGDANRDPLPHALTHEEADTVQTMMGAIIKARGGNDASGESGSNPPPTNSKLGSDYQKQRVIFAETEKWW